MSEPTPEQEGEMRRAIGFISSWSTRVKGLKDLGEALAKIVGLERLTYGLNSSDTGDGLPVVHIRDYTGRGDPDSPFGDRSTTH